jgi:hypothetical protein
MVAQCSGGFVAENRWAEWNNRLSGKGQRKTANGMIKSQETNEDMSYTRQGLGYHIEPGQHGREKGQCDDDVEKAQGH